PLPEVKEPGRSLACPRPIDCCGWRRDASGPAPGVPATTPRWPALRRHLEGCIAGIRERPCRKRTGPLQRIKESAMKLAWILWIANLLPQPAADSLCLATTVYLEARNQSELGQMAVAEV